MVELFNVTQDTAEFVQNMKTRHNDELNQLCANLAIRTNVLEQLTGLHDGLATFVQKLNQNLTQLAATKEKLQRAVAFINSCNCVDWQPAMTKSEEHIRKLKQQYENARKNNENL